MAPWNSRLSGYYLLISILSISTINLRGTALAQWLRCSATNRKVAGSIPAGVIGVFIDIKSFRSHYGTGINSASNRNEYKEYSLGVKAAGASGWHTSILIVPLSGNLRILTFWCRNYFFNLAHSVYKTWIIQEPNKLELWNKLHFEEEEMESIYHV